MPTVYRKIYTEETEEELLAMSYQDVTYDLTEKEISFCNFYLHNKNMKTAALKAGYSKQSANHIGWKIRQKPYANRYICWLKLRMSQRAQVTAMDIIDMYAKIAFADITDFVSIKDGKIRLRNGDAIDGQIVTKVRENREGVLLELADKMEALQRLERYFDVMPKDWKHKVEERKVELLEKRYELDLRKYEDELDIQEELDHDPILKALEDTIEETWGDE